MDGKIILNFVKKNKYAIIAIVTFSIFNFFLEISAFDLRNYLGLNQINYKHIEVNRNTIINNKSIITCHSNRRKLFLFTSDTIKYILLPEPLIDSGRSLYFVLVDVFYINKQKNPEIYLNKNKNSDTVYLSVSGEQYPYLLKY